MLLDTFKIRKIRRLFLVALAVLLGSGQGSGARAVYISHLKADQDYQKAAAAFASVVLIQGQDATGRTLSAGSGTLIRGRDPDKTYVLTASHVLRGAPSYRVIFQGKRYPLQKISHFQDFLFEAFPGKTILVAKDLQTRERLFVLRLQKERDRLKEVVMSYGLDLGCGVVSGLPEGVQTYALQDQGHGQGQGSRSPQPSWIVGFGESGSGSYFGQGFSFWIRGSGTKRAFEAELVPRYQFTLLGGETMETQAELYAYTSLFTPGDGTFLSGHVGPGDSGGPAVSSVTGKIVALVSGTISRVKRPASPQETFWQSLIRSLGKVAGARSPLSYLLWQEANIYGSEALYAGVGAPLIQQWIHSQETATSPS